MDWIAPQVPGGRSSARLALVVAADNRNCQSVWHLLEDDHVKSELDLRRVECYQRSVWATVWMDCETARVCWMSS